MTREEWVELLAIAAELGELADNHESRTQYPPCATSRSYAAWGDACFAVRRIATNAIKDIDEHDEHHRSHQ